jgi:hypothetical protein
VSRRHACLAPEAPAVTGRRTSGAGPLWGYFNQIFSFQ